MNPEFLKIKYQKVFFFAEYQISESYNSFLNPKNRTHVTQGSERDRERVVPRVKSHGKRKLSKSLTSLGPHTMLEARISAKWSKLFFLLLDFRILIPATATATQPFNVPTKHQHPHKLKRPKFAKRERKSGRGCYSKMVGSN